MKKNKNVYIVSYDAYTDKVNAEVAGDGRYLKRKFRYVGANVYVLFKSSEYSGPLFHIDEVIEVFCNLKSAVRSKEWKAAVNAANYINEDEGDGVVLACQHDDGMWYTIVRVPVYKGAYFITKRERSGRHSKLLTSGIVDSRKVWYEFDGLNHVMVASRSGNRNNNIRHIFGYDVVECDDGYKVYNGDELMFALPRNISFMGLIREIADIDGFNIIGWWE